MTPNHVTETYCRQGLTDFFSKIRNRDFSLDKLEEAERAVFGWSYPIAIRLTRSYSHRIASLGLDAEQISIDAMENLLCLIANSDDRKLARIEEIIAVCRVLVRNAFLDQAKARLRKKRGPNHATIQFLDTDSHREIAICRSDPRNEAEWNDQYRECLRVLETHDLQTVFQLRVAGHTNAEIAERLCCSKRTIERKHRLLQKLLGPVLLQNDLKQETRNKKQETRNEKRETRDGVILTLWGRNMTIQCIDSMRNRSHQNFDTSCRSHPIGSKALPWNPLNCRL